MTFPKVHVDGEVWNGAAVSDLETRASAYTDAAVAAAGGGSIRSLSGAWVDMCAAPYNCTPGTDVTTALQAAINAANANNQDTTIYFSQPGAYTIGGAFQYGTSAVGSIPYAGQILIPARPSTVPMLTIRILGLTPADIGWAETGDSGVILRSTAGPAVTTTTTAAYSAGAAAPASFAVNPLPHAIPWGGVTVIQSGANWANYVTNNNAASGAAAVPISPWSAWGANTMNATYPIGSTVAFGGYVFDAIVGDLYGGRPFTNVHLIFEDITIRTPLGAPVGGVNGASLFGMYCEGQVSVDTPSPGGSTAPSGSGVGITFPLFNNGGQSGVGGKLQVLGYAVGLACSEHFTAADVFLSWNTVNLMPQGGGGLGHAIWIGKACLQAASSYVWPSPQGGAVNIDGLYDMGDNVGWAVYNKSLWWLNDPLSLLYGRMRVQQWSQSAAPGFPVLGATNVKVEPYGGRAIEWPRDSFVRYPFLQSSNFIGVTADTHHKWLPVGQGASETTFTSGSGKLFGTSSSAAVNNLAVCRYAVGRAGQNRVIRGIVTLTGVYNVGLTAGWRLDNGWCVSGSLVGGRLQMSQRTGSGFGTWTTLAQSGTGAVVAGNTYRYELVVETTVGGLYLITPYLNGVPLLLSIVSGGGVLAAEDTILGGAGLSTGAAITSIPLLRPTRRAMPQGAAVVIAFNGNTQTFTTSASVAAGVQAVPVNSLTPTFAFPAGSPMTYQTGGYILSATEAANMVDGSTSNFIQDGLSFYQDTASWFSYFGVGPL